MASWARKKWQALLAFVLSAATDPVVETPLGSLRGVDYGDFFAYKGVPYAEKPARFEAPRPKLPWPRNQTLDATHFGDACIMGDANKDADPLEAFGESEDCLYANIWVPKGAHASLPVVIFIHGGGFMKRSGSFPGYWGDRMVTESDAPVVFITFNYRLGIFGFFNWEDSAANFGFQDQQLLLQWVQANIRAFGGDPNQVLLTGQSAGAMSVVCHLAAPGSRGLFRRAIANSPVGVHYRSRKENEAFVRTVAKTVGCDWVWTRNITACLLSKSAASLKRADIVPEYLVHFKKPCSECDNYLPWVPVIDPSTLPMNPLESIMKGSHSQVPTVVSSTRNETLAFVPSLLLELADNTPAYNLIMSELFKDRSEKVKHHYRLAPDTADLNNSLLLGVATTDALVTCYVRFLTRALARFAPTFLSTFLVAPHSSEMNTDSVCVEGPPNGASCHAGDLSFILPHSKRMIQRTRVGYDNAEESNLSHRYSREILAFAWGRNTNTYAPYREIEDIGTTWNLSGPGRSQGYHKEHCDFLESIGFAEDPWGAPKSFPPSTETISV